jgi:hypothetical protein
MDPISVSGTGPGPISIGFGGSQQWKYYAAKLPTLTGAGAKATLTMYG